MVSGVGTFEALKGHMVWAGLLSLNNPEYFGVIGPIAGVKSLFILNRIITSPLVAGLKTLLITSF